MVFISTAQLIIDPSLQLSCSITLIGREVWSEARSHTTDRLDKSNMQATRCAAKAEYHICDLEKLSWVLKQLEIHEIDGITINTMRLLRLSLFRRRSRSPREDRTLTVDLEMALERTNNKHETKSTEISPTCATL